MLLENLTKSWNKFVIKEGTWSLPNTMKNAANLSLILNKLKARKYKDMKAVTKDLYGPFYCHFFLIEVEIY